MSLTDATGMTFFSWGGGGAGAKARDHLLCHSLANILNNKKTAIYFPSEQGNTVRI
uniref:Uncharacterized protein n=1 Tax=Anguilla anguilla TaxID=7936 RepID=A0A0E9Q4T9_ANGAN